MSIPVSFAIGPFPAGYCWVSPQQFTQDLFGLGGIITGTIPGAGVSVIVQAAAPAAQYQGVAIWGKLVSGFLEGFYWYNGIWARPHPVPPSSQSRKIWMGTEAALWSDEGGDGTNPATNPPTLTTGAMWQRDTVFGADDGSSIFKVPVGIGVNPTAYNGAPATTIGVGGTGGVEQETLQPAEQGVLTGQVTTDIEAAGADHTVLDTLKLNGVTFNNANLGPTSVPAVAAVNAHQNMPPYVGVIFAKRTARQFIQG